MKIMRSLFLLLLAVLLICGVTGVSFAGKHYLDNEIIVKFKTGVFSDSIKGINRGHGTSVRSVSKYGKFSRLNVPAGKTVEELVSAYSNNPNVEYAEPNYIISAFFTPNDPGYPIQWYLDNPVYGGINMEEAWDIQKGNPKVIVAVIDTGVAYENYGYYYLSPDLAGTSFVAGYDFVNNDTHPNDDEGHGTHVTGTIAQSTNNSRGVAGIAFNASIMPIKVLDRVGNGTIADLTDGIYFAANNGAHVINMSLGGSFGSTSLLNSIAYAYNKGVTIIAASGNDSSSRISYPAAYNKYVIAVGATRYDETRSWYSNYGAGLDIVAPGGDTNVDQNHDGYKDGVIQQTFNRTYNDWSYRFFQGTSMAAPHVAGVAALVISNGVAGPDKVRNALQSSAKDLGAAGWDSFYGWGLLDAYAALNFATSVNNPPVADIASTKSALVGETVTFDGSGSYDTDCNFITYKWDFGDGSTGTGVQPSHEYYAVGVYIISLVVSDIADSMPSYTTVTIEASDI